MVKIKGGRYSAKPDAKIARLYDINVTRQIGAKAGLLLDNQQRELVGLEDKAE
jgi:hypothetical protein